ncbi:DUF1754-domain-containing protein [Whalleya microplaca]|nr:DUF1754-domain-containing protein [Whalleya microplaca]
MPADDYTSARGGGALKLKGGKVNKTKKKKKSSNKVASLEHSLSASGDDSTTKEIVQKPRDDERVRHSRDKSDQEEDVNEQKTEAERRHEEANRKKVRTCAAAVSHSINYGNHCISRGLIEVLTVFCYEPQMLKMLEDPKTSAEFRKTHKERVEGLNTYLSKLSEHHDMPKIGPG